MARFSRVLPLGILLVSFAVPFAVPVAAQDQLAGMPGYERYVWLQQNLSTLYQPGTISRIQWTEDGSAVYYLHGSQHYRVDLRTSRIDPIAESARPPVTERPQPRLRTAGRALQLTDEPSPDGRWTAHYRDYNVVLENHQTGEFTSVTTNGTDDFRYGTGSWVYGEELGQGTAMWWSPDSRLLAFYEMDERHCQVFYLSESNTDIYPTLNTERYPKAGEPNPIAGILIYDLEAQTFTRIQVGGDLEQYVYNIRWSPNGESLLFSRTNRHQNRLEVMAADPATGEVRLVVRETQPTWQNNRPLMRFLEDGQRFIWETERTGWRHYELRHLDGRLLHALSRPGDYPAEGVVLVDEEADLFYYLANSGPFPLDSHLHRVRLNGRNDTRLTQKPLNHGSVDVSPDHRWFIVTYQSIETPPTTALYNQRGQEVVVLATSDLSGAQSAGVTSPEMFTFKAEDGVTDLYGRLHFPSNFNPSRSYPMVLSVYAGPGSRAVRNTYSPANAITEFGFIVAQIDGRGTSGRGKAFEGMLYQQLGIVEMKDQADGVRHLIQRPYIDGDRVGIFGHSYGGYISALGLVKFPDVFHVGVAGAPVTDWKNYDTIYTERYMRTPQENPDGYRDGSCLTFADQLEGKLLILHGLIDDNVHPSNTWQLIDALQRAGKSFDLMIWPRARHGLGRDATNMRFEHLIRHLKPEPSGG